MKKKSIRRKLTSAQHKEKLLRRKNRQAEQIRFEKNLRRKERAEILLVGSLILMFILSFFIFADRVCSGALSVLMLVLLIFHPILLGLFKELWKNQFLLIVCTYAASAAIIALFSNIQSAVFVPLRPMVWIFAAWGVLLALWLFIRLGFSETRLKSTISSVLLAASLFSICFFCADRVNISFDRAAPQTVSAQVLKTEKVWSESSYTYWIKAAFALGNGSRTTHRFCVLRTDDYEQLSSQAEITLLRHEGALGSEWYEIKLPE